MKKQSHTLLLRRTLIFILPIILGLGMGLSFAPWHYIWILFITVPLILRMGLNQKSATSIFFFGLFVGIGYYFDGFYWIIYAFNNSDPVFSYFGFFAALGVSGCLALVMALALLLTHFCKKYLPISIGFVLFFGILDYVRMLLIPWNAIGYASFAFFPLTQVGSVVGIYGLNILILLPAALLYDVIKAPQALFKRLYFSLGFGLWLALVFYGYGRLHAWPTTLFNSGVPLRLIATQFPQKKKWDIHYFKPHVESLINSLQNLPPNGLVLFPETVLPVDFSAPYNQDVVNLLGSKIPSSSVWVVGSFRKNNNQYFNSLIFYADHNRLLHIYNKRFLVPLAESIPFSNILPNTFFSSFTKGKKVFLFTFNRGGKTVVLVPSICYEIAFPNVLKTNKNVDTILHSTNDAWYNRGAEMYEHLDMARMRAIEQGVGVVISSNMGLNTIVDPLGRIIKQTQNASFLDGYIPYGLYRIHHETIYKKWINIPFYVLIIILFFIGIILQKITFVDKSNRNASL